MVEVRALELPGVFEFLPPRFGDARGFLSETWSREAMATAGFDMDFVQDNHSFSAAKGVIRGLHFQVPPAAQDKLVRVSRGAVFDVAVDIRRGSPSFGRWAGLVLSAERWNQLLIPRGFAHGFLTLEENCEVQYKVSAPYRPEHDRAIRYDDPAIGIAWPAIGIEVQLSAKDAAAPLLADTDTGFVME
jgi:dTDP-4-dehydrorhamnose 3,5-epimerase